MADLSSPRSSRMFSSPRKEAPTQPSGLFTPPPPPRPWQPRIHFPPLWPCLFWTFHLSGITHRVASVSGVFPSASCLEGPPRCGRGCVRVLLLLVAESQSTVWTGRISLCASPAPRLYCGKVADKSEYTGSSTNNAPFLLQNHKHVILQHTNSPPRPTL